MRAKSWHGATKSSTQRGYGYAWQKARAEYLREHPYCVFCLRDAGITATTVPEIILACARRGIPAPLAQVVDHRIPHRGDPVLFWDRKLWQGLCKPHHDGEKQQIEKGGRVSPRIGLDGFPIEADAPERGDGG